MVDTSADIRKTSLSSNHLIRVAHFQYQCFKHKSTNLALRAKATTPGGTINASAVVVAVARSSLIYSTHVVAYCLFVDRFPWNVLRLRKVSLAPRERLRTKVVALGQEHLELFGDKELPNARELQSVTAALDRWNREATNAAVKVKVALGLCRTMSCLSFPGVLL